MQPHSTILRSSHFSETGLVKKSLHPAASATTLSDCKLDAVSATMMTELRKGDAGGSVGPEPLLSLGVASAD
jgi:hypothetical protein